MMKIKNSSQSLSENTTKYSDKACNNRPRNLGALGTLSHLDANWGTSLAYVLPLSLSLTGRLAPVYMIIVSIVMFIVANGYKIICKHNTDGGGVYSSLKKINKFLAIVGALLLVTDYIVTEALSISDSYHYLSGIGIEKIITDPTVWTVCILILLSIVNWRGPNFSGKLASVASLSTFFLSGTLAIAAIPLIPEGIKHIGEFNQSILDLLRNTVGVLLALSGVEAISNMTGVMKDPETTSRKAINFALLKVIFTTIVLGIAMNALPVNANYHTINNSLSEEIIRYKNDGYLIDNSTGIFYRYQESNDLNCVINKIHTALSRKNNFSCTKIRYDYAQDNILVQMGTYLAGRYSLPQTLGSIYGWLIGISYGLLLIFAGNTAIISITNLLFVLAKDGELPKVFTKLNKNFNVPIAGLIFAVVMPIIVILLVGSSVENLAALYAVGMVGAVTLSLIGATWQVKGNEKIITGLGAVVMVVLLLVLLFNKIQATLFACIILIIGLLTRTIQKHFQKH